MKKLLFVLVVGLSMLTSCKTQYTSLSDGDKVLTTPIGKGFYVQEVVAVHTNVGGNDTASILIYGPDTVVNDLVTKADQWIQKKVPGIPLPK